MTGKRIEADYLVIGAGAMGMAFTDVLLNETDATVVLVDKHHQPGGHWNDAYPFVRLHQPSAFYGVNSRPLGSDTIDVSGWNKGLHELATSSEVLAYFDQVMNQHFLPSGRVQYFPLCAYQGHGRFTSLLSQAEHEVAARKVVDATYMNVMVPSVRGPLYTVDPEAHCVAPNGLPRVMGQYEAYVVVGAGKTGMDACLFLLKNGVEPDAIRWIMPRDSWLLDRAHIQPGSTLADSLLGSFVRQMTVIAESDTVEDMFARLNADGQLLRLDETIKPTMYRCATVSRLELEQLRRLRSIIRQGRVQGIERDRIVLDQGAVPTNERTLHVDCTADGLATRPAVPVFAGDAITLQSVRTCQQVFSAAFIGHVEAIGGDDAVKNELCTPVPHPDTDTDFLRTALASSMNEGRWMQDPALVSWLQEARLDGLNRADILQTLTPADQADMERFALNAMTAIGKLQRYINAIDKERAAP